MSLVPDGDLKIFGKLPPNYTIRKAERSDAEAIFELINMACDYEFVKISSTVMLKKHVKILTISTIEEEHSCMSYKNTVLACYKDSPIGLLAAFNPKALIQKGQDIVPAGFHDDRELVEKGMHEFNAFFCVSYLAVKEDHRNTGIAFCLTCLAGDWFESGTLEHACLLVLKRNPVKKLFSHLKFKPTNHTAGEGNGILELWVRKHQSLSKNIKE